MIHKKHLVAILAPLILLSLVPLPYLASPEWQVTVVDELGAPLSGMTVRLSFKNYSVEWNGHEEDRTTDSNGSVEFPSQRGFVTSLQRVWFSTLMATSLAHASFGPHAYVMAFGKGKEGQATNGSLILDWTGTPKNMKSRIVANPVMR